MSNAALRPNIESFGEHHTGVSSALDRRIVMCGSMSFLGHMNHIRYLLEAYRVQAVVPDDVDSDLNYATPERYNQFKREVSLAHMRKIHHHKTGAILVANFDKHGIRGYIGPNTFAEIAIAFFSNKLIFLLNGIPAQYEDELTAWGAQDVHGDINVLVGELGRQWRQTTDQLRLPEF